MFIHPLHIWTMHFLINQNTLQLLQRIQLFVQCSTYLCVIRLRRFEFSLFDFYIFFSVPLFALALSISLFLYHTRTRALQSDHQAKIPRFIYLPHLHHKQSYFSIFEYMAAFEDLYVSGIFLFDFDISVFARFSNSIVNATPI